LTLVVLVVFSASGYWYTTLQKENVDHTRWLPNSFDAVRSIHFQLADTPRFTLAASQQSEWEVQISGDTSSIKARAVSDKVDEFLRRLASVEPLRSLGRFDSGRQRQFGIEKPDLKVIINFRKSTIKPLTIKLASGDHSVVYGWNSRNPELVYEFNEKVLGNLALTAESFFDKRVLFFDENAISKVQLVQPFGSSWLVEKHKEGYFFSLPGYLKGKPASDSALKLYIHSLALLQARQFVLESTDVDKRIPALTLRLWRGTDSEPSTVAFYTVKENPGQYLGQSSWLTVPFLLDAQSVGQLVKSAFDVQGRSVIKLDLGTVARLVVIHGENNYAIERSTSGWRLLDSKKDLQGIDMFLWRFTELQFEALPINNLPDSAVRLMYCKLADKNGDTLTELTFYADPKLPQGQCWMKNGGGMFYPVSSRLLKDLQGMFPSGSSEN